MNATQNLVDEKSWLEMTDAEFVAEVRSWPRVSDWDEPGLADDVLAEMVRRLEAAQRPPVSPEQREALEWAGIKALVESAEVPTGVRAHLLGGVVTIREAVDAESVVRVVLDAILAVPEPTP